MSDFLSDKTGVTGAWTLGAGLTAVAISKEILIIHNETIVGISIAGVIYWLYKKIGPQVAEYLDNSSKEILDNLNQGRNEAIESLKASIKAEENMEVMLQCRTDAFEILRENGGLAREEEYRRRQLNVYNEVRRRLDYQLEMEKTEKMLQQEHLVDWIQRAVTQSLTAKTDQSLPQCISEVKKLATASA